MDGKILWKWILQKQGVGGVERMFHTLASFMQSTIYIWHIKVLVLTYQYQIIKTNLAIMEITYKDWHVARISPLPTNFMQRTYNAGSHQYKGCCIQPSSFVNDICIYVNHEALHCTCFLGNVVVTELTKKLPVLIHYHVHWTLYWSQMSPIQTSTSNFIILICTNLSSSTCNRTEVRRHVIHFMYVKWDKAANTLWNQE
jgi:hypothetical protein